MYMRVVRNALQPGQIDEFTRRWETYFPSRYTAMSGFRHAYLGHDLAGNAILAVTVWDAKPDEAEIATHVAEFRPMVADISSGPPSFEEYDLVSTL
jgi:heme-degrading monooxygenase HmoA